MILELKPTSGNRGGFEVAPRDPYRRMGRESEVNGDWRRGVRESGGGGGVAVDGVAHVD